MYKKLLQERLGSHIGSSCSALFTDADQPSFDPERCVTPDTLCLFASTVTKNNQIVTSSSPTRFRNRSPSVAVSISATSSPIIAHRFRERSSGSLTLCRVPKLGQGSKSVQRPLSQQEKQQLYQNQAKQEVAGFQVTPVQMTDSRFTQVVIDLPQTGNEKKEQEERKPEYYDQIQLPQDLSTCDTFMKIDGHGDPNDETCLMGKKSVPRKDDDGTMAQDNVSSNYVLDGEVTDDVLDMNDESDRNDNEHSSLRQKLLGSKTWTADNARGHGDLKSTAIKNKNLQKTMTAMMNETSSGRESSISISGHCISNRPGHYSSASVRTFGQPVQQNSLEMPSDSNNDTINSNNRKQMLFSRMTYNLSTFNQEFDLQRKKESRSSKRCKNKNRRRRNSDQESGNSSDEANNNLGIKLRMCGTKQLQDMGAGDGPEEECGLNCNCFSRQQFVDKITSLLPILVWMSNYSIKSDLFSDIVTGLTIIVFHVPQSMGYSLIAQVPPVYGLYTALFPALIYSLMGTSRHCAIGMFAVISLMTGSLIDQVKEELSMAGNFTPSIGEMSNVNSSSTIMTPSSQVTFPPELNVQIAVGVTFLIGLYQLAFGLLRLGFISVYLSEQLVSGFTTAASLYVLTSQIPFLFGLHHSPHFTGPLALIKSYWYIFNSIHEINYFSLIASLTCCLIILAFKLKINGLITAKTGLNVPFPIELVLVIIGTLLSNAFSFKDTYHVAVVGPIPSGLPAPSLPNWSLVLLIAKKSIPMAIVAYTLTISVGKIFATKHNYAIDPNQELLALGSANLLSSFFTCLPSAASLSRSAVQEATGGKTQLVSLVNCLGIVFVLYFAGPALEQLPNCILSAIIVVALKSLMMQFADFVRYWRVSKLDSSIWLVTFCAVFLLDVDLGLYVGLGYSLLTLIYKSQRPKTYLLGSINRSDVYVPMKKYAMAQKFPGIIIYQFCGPLHFANTEFFKKDLILKTGVSVNQIIREREKELRGNGTKNKKEENIHEEHEGLLERSSCFNVFKKRKEEEVKGKECESNETRQASLETGSQVRNCSGSEDVFLQKEKKIKEPKEGKERNKKKKKNEDKCKEKMKNPSHRTVSECQEGRESDKLRGLFFEREEGEKERREEIESSMDHQREARNRRKKKRRSNEHLQTKLSRQLDSISSICSSISSSRSSSPSSSISSSSLCSSSLSLSLSSSSRHDSFSASDRNHGERIISEVEVNCKKEKLPQDGTQENEDDQNKSMSKKKKQRKNERRRIKNFTQVEENVITSLVDNGMDSRMDEGRMSKKKEKKRRREERRKSDRVQDTNDLFEEREERRKLEKQSGPEQQSDLKPAKFAACLQIPTCDLNGLPSHIIIDCSMFSYIDTAGVSQLKSTVQEYESIGIRTFLAGIATHVDQMLELDNFYKEVPPHHVYITIHDAVHHAQDDQLEAGLIFEATHLPAQSTWP